jgi:hypothetical protein
VDGVKKQVATPPMLPQATQVAGDGWRCAKATGGHTRLYKRCAKSSIIRRSNLVSGPRASSRITCGTLLASRNGAAGQQPAKRFPSRARAGPNAGLAASYRSQAWTGRWGKSR